MVQIERRGLFRGAELENIVGLGAAALVLFFDKRQVSGSAVDAYAGIIM